MRWGMTTSWLLQMHAAEAQQAGQTASATTSAQQLSNGAAPYGSPLKLSLGFCSSPPAPFAGERVTAQSDLLLGQHLHTAGAVLNAQSQNC